MKVARFGLALRIDMLNTPVDRYVERRIFDEIFAVLTVSDTKGMNIFGAVSEEPSDEGENIYYVVFTGGKLSPTRRVFKKLDADAGVSMYLAANRPFIQTNALLGMKEPHFFGSVQRDGSLAGGDNYLRLTVPKKRGRGRAVWRGIKVLMAPASFGADMDAYAVIRSVSMAARHNFPGVKVVPLPLMWGQSGTMDALVTAANGAYRRVGLEDGSELRYGVLHGRTAVIELHGLMENGRSESAGQLVKRALDEGIKDIYIFGADAPLADRGAGFLRTLGVALLGSDGQELPNDTHDMDAVAELDTEYIHPRASSARFTVVSDAEPAASTLAAALELLKPRRLAGIDGFLEAADYARMLRGVALVITGERHIGPECAAPGSPVFAVASQAAARKVPVAIMGVAMGAEVENLYTLGNVSIMELMGEEAASSATREELASALDSAAHRMFRFIRIGRDVEKIGAPKPPRMSV